MVAAKISSWKARLVESLDESDYGVVFIVVLLEVVVFCCLFHISFVFSPYFTFL